MNYRTVEKTMRKYHLYKGAEAEKRSLQAIFSHLHELPWIIYPRRATESEDQGGVDIVVYTRDIGKIFVQIKSSYKNAEKFYRKHPDKLVAMIIIKEEYSNEKVWQAVKAELIEFRRKILLLKN
jgi:hypothetical protein